MRLTTLLMVALICTVPVVGARYEPPSHYVQVADQQSRQNRGGSKDGVARQAQRMNGGGRVLSVEPVNGGYRVKLLKDGDVRIVFVPER